MTPANLDLTREEAGLLRDALAVHKEVLQDTAAACERIRGPHHASVLGHRSELVTLQRLQLKLSKLSH